MVDKHEILADRLNEQPTIFRGCSSQELVMILWIATLVWIPLCVFFAALVGYTMVGFSLGGIGVGLTVFVVATIFQKLKRGKPIGYYHQVVTCMLHDKHIWRSKFIRHTGTWGIGREQMIIKK